MAIPVPEAKHSLPKCICGQPADVWLTKLEQYVCNVCSSMYLGESQAPIGAGWDPCSTFVVDARGKRYE